MKKLTLTLKEFVFLAAKTGNRTLYGIDDPFYGMSKAQIKMETEQIINSLVEKGIAKTGFDVEFNVSSHIIHMIRICTSCDRYMVYKKIVEKDPLCKVLYGKGENVVVLTLKDDKVDMEAATIHDYSKQRVKQNNVKNQDVILLDEEQFVQLKKLAVSDKNKALDFMRKFCTDETINSVLIEALNNKYKYSSLIMLDFETKSHSSLSYIDSPNFFLEISMVETENVDNSDKWAIKKTKRADIYSKQQEVINKFMRN